MTVAIVQTEPTFRSGRHDSFSRLASGLGGSMSPLMNSGSWVSWTRRSPNRSRDGYLLKPVAQLTTSVIGSEGTSSPSDTTRKR